MDIPRPNAVREQRRRQVLYVGTGVVLLAAIAAGSSRLRPGAPTVERSTVWTDTVKRGAMLRQVRGLGILVPEEIRLIPAMTEGRVEKILVRPGTAVTADTIIVVLSNPEVEKDLVEAQFQLKAAEAEFRSTHIQRQSLVLSQKAEAARAQREYTEARLRAETDAELAKFGIISELNLKLSQGMARQLATQAEIEQHRLENSQRELEAQLALQKSRVEQYRATYDLARTQRKALHVRAGITGLLQELAIKGQSLQAGQQVSAGTTLATVADPTRLKAEIRIPETQAKDLALGLPAAIDTRNSVILGRVARIDPAAQGGTVTVDVALEGPVPPGARPQLSIEGTIDLERLTSVLYVGRPSFGQDNSTVGMFRLESDGTAVRVPVKLGRSSVNTVEIVEGLREGDQVVLSDMSRWDNLDRVRLQ